MTSEEVGPGRLDPGPVPQPGGESPAQPENGSPMRVIGYARVSTVDQAENGASLPAQQDQIRRECEYRGFDLVDVLTDGGYTGTNTKRPALQEALARIEAGEASMLMATKLDRLSRSPLDFHTLMERAKANKFAVSILDIGLDTRTAMGEAMAGMAAVFAQLEHRRISERTKEALAVKRAQGVRLGRPPELDPAVKARIRSMRESGLGVSEIARVLNEEGVPAARGGLWSHKAVAWVLR